MKDRVTELRNERGFTLEELLARIQEYQPSMAWSTMIQIVNGHRDPRLESLMPIARALNTTVSYLIGEIEDPSPVPNLGDTLPITRSWSDRLSRLPADDRQDAIETMEKILSFAERLNAPPTVPDATR